jgi:hypothetical protein
MNGGILDYCCADYNAHIIGVSREDVYDITQQVAYVLWPWVPGDTDPIPPSTARFPDDVTAVAVFLAMAAELIQSAMHGAQYELAEGKPNSYAGDLEKYRRLVSKFSDTARHLVQPAFGPARGPVTAMSCKYDS